MGTPQVKVRTISDLTHEEKAELNALSKDVYGASSRWQKLITKGYAKLLTEEVTEYVPNPEDESKEGTERKVQMPVLRKDGAKQSVQTYHTVDSIKAEMVDRKAKLDEIRAILKKQQDDAREKQEKEQLSKQVHQDLSGTAV